MNVSQLQELLRSVVQFASASKASATVVSDLEKAVSCLAPFSHRTVEEWSAFLVVAEEYHRTGKIPEVLTPKKAPGRASAAKLAEPEAVKAIVLRFQALSDRARAEGVSHDLVEKELKAFEKMGNVNVLREAAKELGIQGKAKKEILAAMRDRVFSRMESAMGTKF